MKRISLILLSLLALCSLDGGGKTIHRSFRGGYPSAVTEARIQSVSAVPAITAGQAKIVREGEYNSKEDENNFIIDLYGAINNAYIIVFDNIDQCSASYLAYLEEILLQGKLSLNKRYVLNNKQLTDEAPQAQS